METLYYTAPPDEVFEEMKKACIDVWSQCVGTYEYASRKIKYVEDIGNIKDNFVFMFAMFDILNQQKVVAKLSGGTKKELRDRLRAGGNTEIEIATMGL